MACSYLSRPFTWTVGSKPGFSSPAWKTTISFLARLPSLSLQTDRRFDLILYQQLLRMEQNPESENHILIEQGVSQVMEIDPKRDRFPCCIVWSPLPVISWLIPFIGHVGICRDDGVILDFAGPNFVCVDNFTFGAPTRYIQISKEKCCNCPSSTENIHDQEEPTLNQLTWDEALRKSTREFQHRSYNLFTCNCHSFVANNLNRLGFQSGGWNVVTLAILFFLKGRWVSFAACVKSVLPFLIIFGLGLILGGWTFLTFWALFTLLLVGWFVIGTYCFRNFILL